jgi:hypothetical protein
MNEELRRFIKQKIQDFVADSIKPFPTVLCERDNPRITELVRKYCLFANTMIPYRGKHNFVFVSERLNIQRGGTDFGDLYNDVNLS